LQHKRSDQNKNTLMLYLIFDHGPFKKKIYYTW
jgi:hypothetical protein